MAFLHEEFPSGGAERVTIDVARFLAAKGVAVTIITSRICRELIPEEFKEHGIEIYQVAHTHLQRRVDNIREMATLIEAQHIEALVFTRTFHHLPLLRRLCPQCRIVCVNHGMPFGKCRPSVADAAPKHWAARGNTGSNGNLSIAMKRGVSAAS